jgi:D-arabinose 1-dehydrogenase-like Zn-dependent alcohol dehydrogenase
MGNDEEFAAMVKFIDDHKIIPVVDEIFSLKQAQTAVEKMAKGAQFGKIVLQVNED